MSGRTRHQGSARRAEILARNDAFEDGVCHAIDEMRAIANAERLTGGDGKAADAYADKLEANLFTPQTVPAASKAGPSPGDLNHD